MKDAFGSNILNPTNLIKSLLTSLARCTIKQRQVI